MWRYVIGYKIFFNMSENRLKNIIDAYFKYQIEKVSNGKRIYFKGQIVNNHFKRMRKDKNYLEFLGCFHFCNISDQI